MILIQYKHKFHTLHLAYQKRIKYVLRLRGMKLTLLQTWIGYKAGHVCGNPVLLFMIIDGFTVFIIFTD